MLAKPKKPFYLKEISDLPCEGRKILLCHHGLNQNPAALYPLLKDLESSGAKCFVSISPGHDQPFEPTASVMPQDYLQRHRQSFDYLKTLGGSSLSFFGYSFGGLQAATMIDQCPFERMVLLAPALKIRSTSHMIRLLLPWQKKIRSVSLGSSHLDKHYRLHQVGVPVEIYQSFFEIYQQFQRKSWEVLAQTSTLVALHPRDELIASQFIKKWVDQTPQWQLQELSNREGRLRRFNHLCFDEAVLGVTQYRSLLERVRLHLSL